MEVPDPNSLMQIFDNISYAKGSCICRMLHNYLDGPDFTKSLKRYLTVHGNSNAKTDDLLSIMDEEFQNSSAAFADRFGHESEHLSVSQFIKPWI